MMEPYQIYLEGYLAVILMLNHFIRNIFRNTPKAFSGGENGLEISLVCYEMELANLAYRQLMLIPMMHSENITI